MSTKELQAELGELVKQAEIALVEAERFADKHGLDFSFSPAYGMGGYYDGEEGEWNPSSESC